MAHGKKQFARHFCPDCNLAIGTFDYLKSQATVNDFNFPKYCKACRARVVPTAKDQKNKS